MSDNAYFNQYGQILFGREYEVLLDYPAASATGTHGTYTAGTIDNTWTFTDATAANFTAAMVGQTITITGSSDNQNNGTFIVVGYTSATVITIYNAYGVADTGPLTWTIVPSPSILAGDIAQAYISVMRAANGLTVLTTTDPFPQYVGLQADVCPSTAAGSWHIEVGNSVQNIGGFHPFFPEVSVPVNSISVPFTTYNGTTATDLVPTAVTGTNGTLPNTATGANYVVFEDSSVNTFTRSMVGSYITITNAVAPSNNGTFLILGYINVSTIIIANPLSVAATGVTWSVSKMATVSCEVTYNNGPIQ
jgi:hypothetical protein